MSSKRVYFENARGVRLSGIIDWPETQDGSEVTPKSEIPIGLFCHCFTCSKDLKAIVRISRRLAKHGIAILRFDFTGLGGSKGSFSDSNFDTNLEDVDAAVEFLNREHRAPSLFIGHSLGGAALMVKTPQVESVQALVTIASPSSTEHLAGFLSKTNPDIESMGEGHVEIGGRKWLLKKQLLDNLRNTDLPSAIQKIDRPHLIMHPPEDATLPYWHAEKLFELTGGAKAMCTLDGSDHLLVENPDDVRFVADLIHTWTSRYL